MRRSILLLSSLLIVSCTVYGASTATPSPTSADDPLASLPTAPCPVTPSADARTWTFDTDWGPHLFTGELSSSGEGTVERVLLYMTGLTDGPGPHRQCRSAYVVVSCSGDSASRVAWHSEPYRYFDSEHSSWVLEERSPDFACGDAVSPVVLSYDRDYSYIVIEMPAGVGGNVTYTLEARIGSCP